MALPKQNRLGSSRDFSRVHRRGKRASTQHLAVRALRKTGRQIPVSRSAESSEQPAQKTQPRHQLSVELGGAESESADGKPSALSSSFGISISRKVSKRAVVRNRIKRRIKAIIRRNLPNMAPGWQVVIVVRPAAVECGFDDFLRELEGLLKKLKILN